MKHDYKNQEKEIYNNSTKPCLITVPKYKYLCIKGKGNPNDPDFSKRIGVLFPFAYAVKFLPKKGFIPDGYFDYNVYPLEGLWSLTETGIAAQKDGKLIKEELEYTLMIRQPDFVNKEIFEKAFEVVKKKIKDPYLNEVYFAEIEDGMSVQIMHKGSYDSEPISFDAMKQFITNNDLELKTFIHREIYIVDGRKAKEENQRTILRYFVRNRS